MPSARRFGCETARWYASSGLQHARRPLRGCRASSRPRGRPFLRIAESLFAVKRRRGLAPASAGAVSASTAAARVDELLLPLYERVVRLVESVSDVNFSGSSVGAGAETHSRTRITVATRIRDGCQPLQSARMIQPHSIVTHRLLRRSDSGRTAVAPFRAVALSFRAKTAEQAPTAPAGFAGELCAP